MEKPFPTALESPMETLISKQAFDPHRSSAREAQRSRVLFGRTSNDEPMDVGKTWKKNMDFHRVHGCWIYRYTYMILCQWMFHI